MEAHPCIPLVVAVGGCAATRSTVLVFTKASAFIGWQNYATTVPVNYRSHQVHTHARPSIADFVASMVVSTPRATTLGFTSEGTLKCTVDIDVMCRCLSDVGVGFIQRHSLCKLQICCDTFRVCFCLCQLVTTLHSHVCVEIAKD